VIEAIAPSGEEFGIGRLLETINENMDTNAMQLSQTIIDRLNVFMDIAVSQDDICMVAVEIKKQATRKIEITVKDGK
jgi:serine phosphatase RsbU (regulator of sigma subunit)